MITEKHIKESPIYKSLQAENARLREVGQMLLDYHNLSEKDFWNKYDGEPWIDGEHPEDKALRRINAVLHPRQKALKGKE